MGWVGVGALIATACFLLYQFPPKWTVSSKPTPTCEDGDVKVQEPAETPSKEITSIDTHDESTNESPTTPKAAATTPDPSLTIPAFQLNDETTTSSNPTPITRSPAPTNDSRPTSTATGVISSMPPPPPPPQPPLPSSRPDTASLMPPPSVPRLRPPTQPTQPTRSPSVVAPGTEGRYPPRLSPGSSSLRPPPSAASSLRVPPSNSLAPTKVTLKPSKPKRNNKVNLQPGFSPLDWAALTANPNNKLRGANLPPGLIKVTPSMLKAQNGRKGTDVWTSYQGKVYNITPYVPFHPGGTGELLRGAGKDSGKLFMEIHPWVNWDAILGECLVGILVSENETNVLDEMD
ncbi:hypothetical protein ASPZODRAFT_166226 [Penicilliopsis zonata CBS 506.65]|uniref:Cytochrome b5 heme-binding domain-containing protein n=1 Tax=Penicilliopsis zonata CBS 506.65 TaxID=1073090 RepID=A0A1L9SID8_9EURO|nr:hypothetical protein ASPZODRAFT_166226 [Penicilliopsis zonata CBS 506.65]OJJ46958.1 hypothetical protein ASPZODRAFT_166226 [Penicilliopsis zonata CBS 506.65]